MSHVWDEWLARQKPRVTRGPELVHVTPEDDYVWVHPDGCMTAQGRAMYPFCGHGSRAVFLGKRGDGYVTTGGGRDETAALVEVR